MPELPELEIYARRLTTFLVGMTVRDIRIAQPFVLRSVDPPIDAVKGAIIQHASRKGKRLCIDLRTDDEDLQLAIHLMRSGRLHWTCGKPLHRSQGCAEFEFGDGWSLQLTEASKRKQASISLYRAEDAQLTPIGLDPRSNDFTPEALAERLTARNRQLKGALTDQTLIAGVGNAYSDEILHEARLSPLQLTQKMSTEQMSALHAAIVHNLNHWIDRIDELTPGTLPTRQPAWRKHFAVHGQFKKPCPRCSTPVARISFAESETNYCPTCQTGGKTLADRRMSKLFRR